MLIVVFITGRPRMSLATLSSPIYFISIISSRNDTAVKFISILTSGEIFMSDYHLLMPNGILLLLRSAEIFAPVPLLTT